MRAQTTFTDLKSGLALVSSAHVSVTVSNSEQCDRSLSGSFGGSRSVQSSDSSSSFIYVYIFVCFTFMP